MNDVPLANWVATAAFVVENTSQLLTSLAKTIADAPTIKGSALPELDPRHEYKVMLWRKHG